MRGTRPAQAKKTFTSFRRRGPRRRNYDHLTGIIDETVCKGEHVGNTRLGADTRILIIGAGVVGAALADDLTRHGMNSVTVVDQGPLYETGGSSSHAPGFAFQTTGSSVMTELARRTSDKLDGLELDGEWILKRVGGLELACDDERMEYLHRRHNLAQSWGRTLPHGHPRGM